MNTLVLQLWEETEINCGIQPDGCSLHIDDGSLNEYISSVYDKRGDYIPDVYDRIVGRPITVTVDSKIYDIVSLIKSVRLQQHEMNNLINLKEIVFDV